MQRLNDKIRLIALDIDGTTLNSSSNLTCRTKNALEKAIDSGVEVVFATGRSFNSLPKEIKDINGVNYAITSNGAHINEILTGNSIYDSYVQRDVVEKILEISNKFLIGLEVFIDGQAYIDEIIYDDIKINGCDFRNAEYILWSRKPVKDINQLLIENSECIENINLCFRDVDEYEKSKNIVFKIKNATFTSSFKNSIEVGGLNTSKKTAIEFLLNKFKIDRKNIMCCGDALNDGEMIEFAGFGVAMGNAWKEIIKNADYVTSTNDEDGVAEVIERYVLR